MHGVLVEGYVEHYNNLRLNSASGYIHAERRAGGESKRPDAVMSKSG